MQGRIKMKYEKILEREIKKTEKEQDEFLQGQECSEYRLGYEDGLKFALQEYNKQMNQMKDYEDDLGAVMNSAAKVSDKFLKDNEQAIKECNTQGFKFVGITKDNKKFNAQFLLHNKARKMQIVKKDKGTVIKLQVPDEILPRI